MDPTLNCNFYKLLHNKHISYLVKIINDCVTYLSPIKNDFYKRNFNHSINDYALGIIDALKSSISWRSYSGPIKGDTLRKKHNEWNKLGVYDEVYNRTINTALKNNKSKELKYQSIDSSFIRDINGSKDAKYNGLYKHDKNKSTKGIKINAIVTTNGLPISLTIDGGNKADSTMCEKCIDNIVINNDPNKYTKHNRYKQYFLADKGYDTKAIINNAIKRGYIPIIPQNKRGIKNKKLLRHLNMKQKNILKKRHIVENYFSWIKRMPKIKHLYEKNINSYKGLLLIASSIIISRRILKNK